jgi:hypothetical protein
MRKTLACLVAVLWAIACSEGGDGGGGGGTECELGAESCGCDEGACDPGLTCLSDRCVRESAGGGGVGGTSGSGGTGGSGQNGGTGQGGSTGGMSDAGGGGTGATTTGGAGGATGGTSGTGSGGMLGGSGGASAGSGASAGKAGASGAGGMCTADTRTDPQNCGVCGHVCKNQEADALVDFCDNLANECCASGMCGPFWGECINQSDGFATCADYCESLGEQCVRQGCSEDTWRIYSADVCQIYGAALGFYTDACTTAIDFSGALGHARCCCADTH